MHVRPLLVLLLASVAYGRLAPLYRHESSLPNRYLVKVKNDGKDIMGDLTDDLLAENERNLQLGTGFGHIDIIDEMDGKYLKLLSLELDYKSLDTVRRHPAVEYVEEENDMISSSDENVDDDGIDAEGIDLEGDLELLDKRITHEDFEYNQGGFYGLDRINQRETEIDGNRTFDGDGFTVNVYVISSGIRKLHRDFECRARMAYDVMDKDGVDCNGDGTKIAGIAIGKNVGVAKGAMVHSVRVHDCNKTETPNRHLKGIQWVSEHRAKPCVVVLTVSLETGSKALDDGAESLVDAGCVVVAKSGPLKNTQKKACDYSPSRAYRVITVAATNKNDKKPEWAKDGMCVDVFAPGVGILTSFYDDDDNYEIANGPDVAVAFVAGVAAIHLGNKVDPADVKERILNDATPCVVEGDVRGAPNRFLFVDPGPGN